MDTRVRDLADAWLASGNWVAGTKRSYRSVVQVHVKPALGDFRLRDVSMHVANRPVVAVAQHSGYGAAEATRTAPSGMLTLAVREGAMADNSARTG